MPDKKTPTEKATPAAILATALIAVLGNTGILEDKGADAKLVHSLIVQLQTNDTAAHDARHAIRAQCEDRQAAFEEHIENRLDDLEEDILITGKEDRLPISAPRFEPPPPVHAEPPKAPKAPPVTVDQLLE